jgi:hypothetical protein
MPRLAVLIGFGTNRQPNLKPGSRTMATIRQLLFGS